MTNCVDQHKSLLHENLDIEAREGAGFRPTGKPASDAGGRSHKPPPAPTAHFLGKSRSEVNL